jgi:branched-chain amino acid transport system ATP-binding protein
MQFGMPDPKPAASPDIILSARGLTKAFQGFMAVDGVDLDIRRGSIHALIGPNGAGKTTCFNLLTKFLQLTSGKIVYDGHDITRSDPAAIARRGLVRSFQISAVFPKLQVMHNVRIALQRRLRGDSFNWWRSERCLSRMDEEAMQILQDLGLAHLSHVRAADLPYGRKRALELATTLALDPKLLLLDEPMAAS